jgi:hypothetical protein
LEAKILRPLLWSGLLEHRSEKIPNTQFASLNYYRKTALFERLLKFDVRVFEGASPLTSQLFFAAAIYGIARHQRTPRSGARVAGSI